MYPEDTSKAVILVVDDNLANLTILSKLLDNEGYEVWVAHNGESALKKVYCNTPDLILLDVVMTGMDGFETCKKLKSLPPLKNIPIIFTTALCDPVEKVKGLSIGAVDYIIKPFHQEEVLVRIKLHLELSRLTQALAEKNSLLQELMSHLEQRVEERTSDLRGVLKELQEAQLELLGKEAKLRHEATHDSLTSLPNRAAFLTRLNQVIELSKIDKNFGYAVLFIDLDRFKVINDSLGHLVGDELLKSVAYRMQNCLSSQDMIARLGGDEFLILLENIREVSDATRVADHLLEKLNSPFQIKNYEVFTGASIGITMSSLKYEEAMTVLRDADVAMYHAKMRGKNRYEILTPIIQSQAEERHQLENDLRKALELKEFCLYYQPIVSLATGDVLGLEALVRWNHPIKGLIQPNIFISMAEETGLIHSLGLWILEEACYQVKRWESLFDDPFSLAINVNFSPIQLRNIQVVDQVKSVLKKTQVSGHQLKVEITESSLLENSCQITQTLKEFRDLGIRISIDDFGTGYSSLSRLHDLPIDILKIDRSFVNRLNSEQGVEIVKTILTLAQRFNMDLVAEGIETPEQMEKLASLGCYWGQGYLFSKPITPEMVAHFILQQPDLFKEIFSQ